MDNIEELRVFWAAKELEDKARWAAKRERIKESQANGYNLPWDEVVIRERAEKGEFWFLYSNKFYQSLAKKPRIYEPSMVAPSDNSASDKESAGEEVQTDTKSTVEK